MEGRGRELPKAGSHGRRQGTAGLMVWLVRTSLRFRTFVVLLAAGLLVFGGAQLRSAPVDALPEFTPPYVEIQTEALGLSAEEVEELVTVPMEGDLLNGVAGIDVIRSRSVLGLSSIVLVFQPGTDILDARQLVQERLTLAHALPNVSKPPAMLQPLSSANRALMIRLSSTELSALELGLLARWTVRPRLLGVSGVANVAMWGHRDHQLHVEVDPERLQRNGVTLQQVVSTVGNAQLVSPLSFLEASTPGASGFIDTPNQRLQVRHVLPISEPEGLARVPLEGVEPGTMTLGDVTDILEQHQPLIGDVAAGDEAALMLVVEKFPGASTLQVTGDVEDALDELAPALSGVEVDPGVFRPASFIEAATENLGWALLAGAILLLAVLLALLVDWRLALVSLVSIPLALVAAALVLVARGETINSIVVAGLVLALAVVVDDVVVGADAVRRRLAERRGTESEESLERAIARGTLESRRPAAFATVILLLGVAPLFFLPSPANAFFEPLAVSFALAVLAALAVVLVVVPALSAFVLVRAPAWRGDGPVVPRAQRLYSRALRRVVERPQAAMAVAAAVVLIGVALLPQLGASVLPTFKHTELLVHVDGAPGTSRPAMLRITTQLASEVRALPGVQSAGVHVGRAVTSDQVGGINAGELWVRIDPGNHDETVAAVREVVGGYPGVDGEVVTYSDERIRAVGALVDGEETRGRAGLDALLGVDEPVAVRLYGKDLAELASHGERVRRELAQVDGVVDARVVESPIEPIVKVEVDLDAAAEHGLKPGDIRRAAATLVQGIVVGSLFEEQKVFDVLVVGKPSLRNSLTSIRELPIDTPRGGQVRLAEVASAEIAPTPTVIQREAASRYVDVVAGVDGRDLGAVLDDVEERLDRLELPLEYYTAVLRDDSTRARAALLAAALALAAVYLLLQAALGSWRLAALFLAALPVALVGGLAAAAIAGGTLTVGSFLGLFALFALGVRHALALAHRYAMLEADAGRTVDASLALRGAEEALRPVLTSALAVAAAFLPLAVAGPRLGYEIAHPLAVVLLGGLVTAVPLALFLLPALYLRFGTRPAPAERVAGSPVLVDLHPGG